MRIFQQNDVLPQEMHTHVHMSQISNVYWVNLNTKFMPGIKSSTLRYTFQIKTFNHTLLIILIVQTQKNIFNNSNTLHIQTYQYIVQIVDITNKWSTILENLTYLTLLQVFFLFQITLIKLPNTNV